ncbi:hypothetical protein GmHk_05G013017 [Glycine max]|nr:hypothetical protein GmHk_05G013017 [Glycine max]
MSKRLQEDWARAAEEVPRVLINLKLPIQGPFLVVKLLLPWLILYWMAPPLTFSPLSSAGIPWLKFTIKGPY